ncbi:MAG TPA: tetratricopeptide repeat protein, partial [Gemmataceae bacterium]|nr:tetratricopeptide repeat protein [Gemmataceae bacterium]
NQLLSWDHVLDKMLTLRPSDGQMYAVRARVHMGVHQWDKGFAAFADAIKLRPDDIDLRLERGGYYAQMGRWKEAAADFDRVMAERPFGEEWYQDACLHVLSGDADGWRKLCGQAAERYGKTTVAADAYTAGRILALVPGAGVDPALAVRLEERAVASQATSAYYLHHLGLAHYRAGHFDAAVHWHRESLKTAGYAATLNGQNLDPGDLPANAPTGANAAPLTLLGLALAYHGLKQPDEARRWLDKANAWLKQANADQPKEEAEFQPPSLVLSDWLEFQVLRREAETALKEAAPGPAK